jgi:hypothetical protein
MTFTLRDAVTFFFTLVGMAVVIVIWVAVFAMFAALVGP